MPADRPTLDWISATLPKAGHRPEENEDSIAVAPARWRFALADGATEGWQSRAWATHLAEACVRRPPTPADFPAWLAAVRRQWRPQTGPEPAAWYAAEKEQQGSFATLVSLEVRPARDKPGGWAWKGVALGDSCFIHVRDGSIELAFPLNNRDEFGDRPPLVPSSSDVACPAPGWLAGFAVPGDLLLLASDAVAACLLDASILQDGLAAISAALRDHDRRPVLNWFCDIQSVVNDDVSAIAIRIPDAPEVV